MAIERSEKYEDRSKHYFQLKGKKAEEIVRGLAEKTFLTDWCYPNPKLSSTKELCDLLVVFDNVAIIWQIKDLKIGKDGKYKKSEVDKNLRQLSGAKRQLFELKTKIELFNSRREKEIFDPESISEVYLVSVLLGEGEDHYSCFKEINGKSIHVFTKEFTQISLNELDTISDFCLYLRLKEAFFLRKKRSLIVVGGEQELLAIYLMEGRDFGNYAEATNIFLDGTIWDGLTKEPRFLKKKEADKISYGWDGIINRAHTGSSKYEVVARELARPNRFERRYLSKVFTESQVASHNDTSGGNLFRRIMPCDGITYCFLFMDDSIPREARIKMLEAICNYARVEFSENKKVIGIATGKKFTRINSYDFAVLDIPTLAEDYIKGVREMQKRLNLFSNPTRGETHEDEYPK